MSDCLFCRIVSGEIPADIVYQNADVIAFRDIAPQAPVHMLVIPRQHVAGVAAAARDHESMLGQVLLGVAEVARQEGVAESGYRVVINSGHDANQTVQHLHAHVLGGRTLTWPPG